MPSCSSAAPSDDAIRAVLEGAHAAEPLGRIVQLERRVSPTGTSFRLEEIDLALETGTRVALLFKDLSRGALLDAAANVKPAFVHDPLREIVMYRDVLRGVPGVARYVASAADVEAERYWLFLERVQGVELFQLRGMDHWRQVAGWIAAFHRRFEAQGPPADAVAHLIACDRAYYRRWSTRARTFTRPDDHRRLAALDRFDDQFDAVLSGAGAGGYGLTHGELYASNILVNPGATPPRICPVDWEMAGLGPSLLDLAALTGGRWTETDQASIVDAYYQARLSDVPYDSFLAALACCHALLAVQWLGWASDWIPPAEHRHDWVDDLAHWLERARG